VSQQDGSAFLSFHEDEVRAQALACRRSGRAAIRPFHARPASRVLRAAGEDAIRDFLRQALIDFEGFTI
jgi:hypothetical protein